MPQYLYCFETTFDIKKEFTRSNKKPDDYAVYKIGKTTRSIHERLSEHGTRVKDVKFSKIVYDCDTLERDLIKELKDKLVANGKIIHRLHDLSSKEEPKLKNIKGLEYYEGQYSDIKPILEDIVSENFQNCKVRKMAVDFICPTCNQVFNVESALKIHERKHETGENVTSFRAKNTEELPPRERSSRIRNIRNAPDYRERSTSLSPPPSKAPSPPKPSKAPSPPKPRRSKSLKNQARSAKQPRYISDFKIKYASPLADYTSGIELRESFIELLKKLTLNENNKRKRAKTIPSLR